MRGGGSASPGVEGEAPRPDGGPGQGNWARVFLPLLFSPSFSKLRLLRPYLVSVFPYGVAGGYAGQ